MFSCLRFMEDSGAKSFTATPNSALHRVAKNRKSSSSYSGTHHGTQFLTYTTHRSTLTCMGLSLVLWTHSTPLRIQDMSSLTEKTTPSGIEWILNATAVWHISFRCLLLWYHVRRIITAGFHLHFLKILEQTPSAEIVDKLFIIEKWNHVDSLLHVSSWKVLVHDPFSARLHCLEITATEYPAVPRPPFQHNMNVFVCHLEYVVDTERRVAD